MNNLCRLLTVSAELRDMRATYNLGVFYDEGIGVRKHESRAARCVCAHVVCVLCGL